MLAFNFPLTLFRGDASIALCPFSTVAQRQSNRLLTGRFLVRIQAVESLSQKALENRFKGFFFVVRVRTQFMGLLLGQFFLHNAILLLRCYEEFE